MSGGLTESERRLVEWLGPGDTDAPPRSLPDEFIDRNKLAAVIADRAPDEYGHLKDERLRQHSLEVVRELGSALERRGVPYAVIKSVPIVPKPVGDVDVLVGDIEAAAAVLAERSFTKAASEPHKAVYERHADDVRVAIHLHAEVSWEGVSYLDADRILDRRRPRRTDAGIVPVPAVEDELLITAAHMLFEQGNGRILLLDVLEYATHADRGTVDVDAMLATAEDNHWSRPLERYLRSLNVIYYELYGRPLDERLERFGVDGLADYDPLFKSWLFSIRVLTAARLYRIYRAGSRAPSPRVPNLFYTYFVDTVDVLAERYGITYTKRRLTRWLNTTSTDS